MEYGREYLCKTTRESGYRKVMKKVLVILGVIILLMIIGGVSFYFWGMGAKSEDTSLVTFVIENGTSKTTVAENLENAGLIRNQYVLDLYLFFSRDNIQAGEYELSPSMTPEEMIKKFSRGDVKINTVSVTLREGLRITDYAKELSLNFDFTEEEFLAQVNDPTFLNELVNSGEYWFLTSEILNSDIYYGLEGYLYPDTYEFLETVTPQEVIITLLKQTGTKLEPYREAIMSSGYTAHQILTLASIVEKEANTAEDRKTAAQVFYSRLRDNWSLGSDVTTYYGVGKSLDDYLTVDDINNMNPYNTRLTDGQMNGKLPIGPICNSDISSIDAVLNPSDTNYYYFVANTCTGEVFFQENYSEFISKAQELQSICATN